MDIISIYNRIILHEQEQKEKFPAQDRDWKPARCEGYTLPPFQIPKNRSKKSQREQLSKVLAFVKYERNIRAAEGCTIMPIPTTNKHMLAIAGSPANASNLIKFMCQIGLISPECEKYRFGSRYEKNNYAKTYRYYYDNEQKLIAYCLLASCWFMHAFAEITESVKATNKALQLTFEHNIANAEEEHKKAAAAVAESARKALAEKKAAEAEAEAARKKRFYDYWQAHAEEKAALLAKKNEAQNALDSIGELATEERAKLQSIIDAIDKELTKDR